MVGYDYLSLSRLRRGDLVDYASGALRCTKMESPSIIRLVQRAGPLALHASPPRSLPMSMSWATLGVVVLVISMGLPGCVFPRH